MKTFTAKEAKTHFGEFLDAMQREPVIVTKNGRSVGIMIPFGDHASDVVQAIHAGKDAGYDEWFRTKVQTSLDRADSGQSRSFTTQELMASIRAKVLAHSEKLQAAAH
ncbi:MAG: type II toxin-antitoxin system Phd/YefM family antitoxin [Burkholderiales bacterium]|nr:MAG: type II toxin-antitoxin system Phd/YefM family antitoxin [Burkholderiales bacterium]